MSQLGARTDCIYAARNGWEEKGDKTVQLHGGERLRGGRYDVVISWRDLAWLPGLQNLQAAIVIHPPACYRLENTPYRDLSSPWGYDPAHQ